MKNSYNKNLIPLASLGLMAVLGLSVIAMNGNLDSKTLAATNSIYVASSGLDTNDGSQTKPIRTLYKALSLAKEKSDDTNIVIVGPQYSVLSSDDINTSKFELGELKTNLTITSAQTTWTELVPAGGSPLRITLTADPAKRITVKNTSWKNVALDVSASRVPAKASTSSGLFEISSNRFEMTSQAGNGAFTFTGTGSGTAKISKNVFRIDAATTEGSAVGLGHTGTLTGGSSAGNIDFSDNDIKVLPTNVGDNSTDKTGTARYVTTGITVSASQGANVNIRTNVVERRYSSGESTQFTPIKASSAGNTKIGVVGNTLKNAGAVSVDARGSSSITVTGGKS